METTEQETAFWNEVEDYIKSLKWAEDTDDYVKIAVAGNIRGVAGFFKKKLEAQRTAIAAEHKAEKEKMLTELLAKSHFTDEARVIRHEIKAAYLLLTDNGGK